MVVPAIELSVIADAGTAFGTLVLAVITYRMALWARDTAQAARDQVDAEIQPLLLDVPFGESWYGTPEEQAEFRRDRADIAFGGDLRDGHPGFSVPVRNVGRGVARISAAMLLTPEPIGRAEPMKTALLPPGETTRILFTFDPNVESEAALLRAIHDGQRFRYEIRYTDLAGSRIRRTTFLWVEVEDRGLHSFRRYWRVPEVDAELG